MTRGYNNKGFTLIELSIVLVIIGLLVGGVLVGQDLIKAAETRAQISQIEKYNSAVNTFRIKFNAIPGDMAISVANQFGFTVGAACSGIMGERDGNGLIHGANLAPLVEGVGETGLFWSDISSGPAGNLIEGQFPNSGAAPLTCAALGATAMSTTIGTTYFGDYFPVGKIGHGTFVYVYETSGYNWYGLSALTTINSGGGTYSTTTISVMQSYNMDRKTDDGLPTTGAVRAAYLTNGVVTSPTNAATDSTTTCYNTSSNVYSIGSAANYGNGGNCALSFRFQ